MTTDAIFTENATDATHAKYATDRTKVLAPKNPKMCYNSKLFILNSYIYQKLFSKNIGS